MNDVPAVLVAGIGNVFLGDDGFGVEVAQALLRRPQPAGVRVVDYGIRGFDLAFAMLDGPGSTILIDALPRGDAPGTLSVFEPDLAETSQPGSGDTFQGHAMTPDAVFALVRALGGAPRDVVVVGCEPDDFGPADEGRMGLSPRVAAAVGEAVALVERLVAERLGAASAGGA